MCQSIHKNVLNKEKHIDRNHLSESFLVTEAPFRKKKSKRSGFRGATNALDNSINKFSRPLTMCKPILKE